MQPMWLWLFSCRQFVDTFENAYWRKLKQMQPMQLWLLSGRRFEDTFENTQHLRIHWSVWDFTGASVNLLERLRASKGFWNFDGASEIFWERLWNVWYQKNSPWKNAPFSLHKQDQGVRGSLPINATLEWAMFFLFWHYTLNYLAWSLSCSSFPAPAPSMFTAIR